MNTEEKRDPGIPECVKVTQNQEEKMNRKREQSIRDFRRFGKYALAAAVLFPVCLYRNPAGILWPVFMGALLFLMSAVSRRERTVSGTGPERKCGMNTFYAAAVMLLSISQCMTASPVLRFLNSLGILFLLAMHLLHSFTDDRNFTIPVYCRGILHVWFLPLFHGADAVRDLYCWRKFRRNDGKQESRYTGLYRSAGGSRTSADRYPAFNGGGSGICISSPSSGDRFLLSQVQRGSGRDPVYGGCSIRDHLYGMETSCRGAGKRRMERRKRRKKEKESDNGHYLYFAAACCLRIVCRDSAHLSGGTRNTSGRIYLCGICS